VIPVPDNLSGSSQKTCSLLHIHCFFFCVLTTYNDYVR